LLVSSDEINRRLRSRRLSEVNDEDKDNYLICESCKGYYKLQNGESPEDFISECDCGGNLIYSTSLEPISEQETLKCPNCGTENLTFANFCQECGIKIIDEKIIINTAKTENKIHFVDEKGFSIQVDRNLTGIELEKTGKVDEAIKLYEMNINENFEGNHPYDRLAIIYRRRKQYNDEIRVLEKAIEVFDYVVSIGRQDGPPKLQRFKERLIKARKLQATH